MATSIQEPLPRSSTDCLTLLCVAHQRFHEACQRGQLMLTPGEAKATLQALRDLGFTSWSLKEAPITTSFFSAKAPKQKAKATPKAKEKPPARTARKRAREAEEVPAEERAYLECLVDSLNQLDDDQLEAVIKTFDALEDGENSVINIEEMSDTKRLNFQQTLESMIPTADVQKAKQQAKADLKAKQLAKAKPETERLLFFQAQYDAKARQAWTWTALVNGAGESIGLSGAARKAPPRRITRVVSEKSLSDSILPFLRARANHEHWSQTAPPPWISTAQLGKVKMVPPAEESNQDTAAGPPSLAGACSDSHLLSLRGGPTESLQKLLAVQANSDTVLAHPRLRALLEQHDGEGMEEERAPRGQKKERVQLSELTRATYYEGQIIKVIRSGILVDVQAMTPGLVRWKSLRGVPRKLLKKGGFLANLRVQKVDEDAQKLCLTFHGLGFGHDTVEECNYEAIKCRVLSWAATPAEELEAQLVQYLKEVKEAAPASPAFTGRMGKCGPRRTAQDIFTCRCLSS
ncbi:unnamed protein product [Effrenium voratum]|nr:unnamed protein product [Effrenium voratum]